MGDYHGQIQVDEKLGNKWWRLNNLYWIQTERGKRVKFVCNHPQRKFYKDLWYFNTLLKARQWGGTTFICLYILDDCLFNSNLEAGIIAHKKDDAQKIFRRKILYPYNNLAEGFRLENPTIKETQSELHFANESNIFVATSVRSGTVQRLLISEYGKICAKFPEKADEIRSGSLNAVHPGSMIWIESTAEGAFGDFYDRCEKAREYKEKGSHLTKLDYKFHFIPWWENPFNVLDPTHVIVSPKMVKYFDALEVALHITLSDEQKAWYVKKAEDQGDKMHQEHPSTHAEAFEKLVTGAYYAEQMTALRKAGNICKVPYDPALPVNTGWDYGKGDMTCIVFHQRHGKQNCFIDYYESSDVGLKHYVKILRDKDYLYDTHYLPHDMKAREDVKEIQLKTRVQILGELWPRQNWVIVPRADDITDAIETVRAFLPTCVFDSGKVVGKLVTGLDAFRREWDPHLVQWKPKPLHDWASHREAAIRSLACGFEEKSVSKKKFKRRRRGGMAA